MEYTSEEKAYIWLDSFALERNEKRRLLSQAGGAAALNGFTEKAESLWAYVLEYFR